MINSVLKAIDIMGAFSIDKPILTLSELSRMLEYPKTTVHTILNTLESRGFIEKTDNNAYALGWAVIPMTQAVRVNVQIRDRAAPLLRELGDFSGISVYLTVLKGSYSLYIYAIESSDRLLARSVVGDRAHMHCTAVGKATLAFMSRDRIEAIIEDVGLPHFTEHTIVDSNALFAELEETRKRGYALDLEEHEVHTYCIGSPIFSEQGNVIGSCSVSGSDPELVQDRVSEFAPAVCYTAQEISRRMGFVPKTGGLLWRESINPMRSGKRPSH
jgi:DNA-binding IclR family transcriptional regulator